MKRTVSFLILLGLVLGAGCNNDPQLEIPGIPESAIPSQPGDFAGSGTCRTCHESIWQTWSHSRHTKKVRDASLDILVNDFDLSGTVDFVKGGAGVTFNVATSVPADQTDIPSLDLGPGIEYPLLGWVNGKPVVKIGLITYDVTYVLGGTGKWKQRYMVTIDNQEYISPVQWNDIKRNYVWYHPENWYEITGDTLTGYLYGLGETPITEGEVRDSWQRRCIGCHVTGVRDITKNADGEFGASIADMENSAEGPYFSEKPIACESCHGPSARHVDLGGGIGTTLNPNLMAADRGDEVCGSCHNRGTSTNAEGFGYPWGEGSLVDNQYRPGDNVTDYYTSVPLDGSKFWQDGARSAKSHHQQWIEHKDTPHGKAGVTCWKCHDPHGSNIDGDLKMPVKQLCISCHDGQGDIDSNNLELHTRHSEPEAQNCRYCHFVQTAKSGIPGDVSSHSYRVIYPQESEETPGLPNSCGECHQDRTTEQLTTMLAARFADVRPVAFATAALNRGGPLYKLDGGQSFDPLGGPISYLWTIKNGPGASFSQSQLIASTGEDAIFVPAAPGTYTFKLVVTNVAGVRSQGAEASVDVPASVVQTPPDLRAAEYQGSTTCKICHSDTHSTWQVTRHPLKTRRPFEGPGVVFTDTDEDGDMDWFQGGFNIASDPVPERTVWDDFDYGPGVSAPVIFFDAGTETYKITIGPITYDVGWILGGTGKWKQRYMATIDEGEYISPVQYNELTNEFVAYHPEHWYTIDGNELTGYIYNSPGGVDQTPVTQLKTRNSWQRRCTVCHATGMRDMTRDAITGEYAASIQTMLDAATGPRLAETGIGCEACHGPGEFHVASPSTAGTIINPAKLSAKRSNESCGQCHNRGTSVNSEGFGFPWGASTVEGHYIPGDMLDNFYTPKSTATDTKAYWPDPFGHAKQHHEQWLDLQWTGHAKSGMTCATCHDSHVDIRSGQLRVPANQLCKSCHPSKVDDQGALQNHSRHANGSPANDCSTCHYVYAAKSAVAYDVRAHSAEIIYPVTSQALLDAGGTAIPNSCMTAKCHENDIGDLDAWDENDSDSNAEATEYLNRMWGDIAPVSIARVFATGGGRSVRLATFTTGDTVTLDGARSYDPNGDRISSWAWTILSAPATSTADLNSRLVSQPTITVQVPGTYTFSLVARDPLKSGRPQTVTITVVAP